MPELAAVRKDSETLRVLRETIADAAGVSEEQAFPAIRDRLSEAAAKCREDVSLRRVFSNATTEFALGSLGTSLATYVFDGKAPTVVGAAALGGAVAFLAKQLRPLLSGDRRKQHHRAELLVRINDRL